MDVVGAQRRMIEQAFAQMREVPIRIGRRRDPLVHLNDMHVLPRELLVRQCAQHQPGVRPPLTAMMKRPRAATAARASAAMIAAALRATKPSSGWTSIFTQ